MLKNISNKIKSLLKINERENIKDVLEDLIEDNANGHDKIDDGTKNIFKNVINLNNKCIEDVMIPRADIDAVSVDTTYTDLVSFIDRTKHSRIPVFDGNLDKILGMIHIRDLFEKINKANNKKNTKISKKMIRKILFSSPSMKVLDLLLKMRSEQIHMSIVVDEFGGTNGIVTIEDLVEEIVGEIKDEHDFEEVDEIKKISRKSFEISARILLKEFEERLNVKLNLDEKNEIDTLGG
ncbi:MAG: ion transporter, partial [Alphaproteobacteria bacterium]|nr:ion transporter [Alphaproteobacteria bacterium]